MISVPHENGVGKVTLIILILFTACSMKQRIYEFVFDDVHLLTLTNN